MSLLVQAQNWLTSTWGLTVKIFQTAASDRTKSLVSCAAYNVVTGTFVGYNALTAAPPNYNRREWWSDVAIHYVTSATLILEATIGDNTSDWIKSTAKTITNATIKLNQARLSIITVTVSLGNETIPETAEAVDVGNHLLNLAILEKWRIKAPTKSS